jgi:steroid delta-isomerase-like uncharacterized protein
MVGSVAETRTGARRAAGEGKANDKPSAAKGSGAKAQTAKRSSARSGGAKAQAKGAKDKTAAARTARPRRAAKGRSVEDVARSYFAAVAARDADAMAEHWHLEGIDDLVPLGIFRGPDEVRRHFAELFAAVPDIETVVDRVIADDRAAAVQWRTSGTFTGSPFQGIEATGRRIELRGADCLEISDGKIMRNTAYYDGAEFARAIGLLPGRDSGAEKAMLAAFNAATRLRHAVGERLAARQAAGS